MLGNIKVFNVVFQVLPDEVLSFPSMDYSIKGIIGFPVILQWRNFRINQSGTIMIGSKSNTASLQNLAFDESAIVLRTRANEIPSASISIQAQIIANCSRIISRKRSHS